MADPEMGFAPDAKGLRMAAQSAIEWLQGGHAWNPFIGCTPCSPGCDHCWARREEDGRFRHLNRCGVSEPGQPYFWRGPVWQGRKILQAPRRQVHPTAYFVCSRSDLFHEGIAWWDMWEVLGMIRKCERHRFIVCTKRPKRMAQALNRAPNPEAPPKNLITLTTVCSQPEANEGIPQLLAAPSACRGLSIEPMLGPVNLGPWLPGHALDWVIVGGESGKGARPMHPDWVRKVRDQCAAAKIPFFFKQWGEWADGCGFDPIALAGMPKVRLLPGGEDSASSADSACAEWRYRVGKKRAGRILDGALHDAVPWGITP